ncbi:MAG: flavin reductase family protein [Pirellulales bacterium]
MPNTDLDAILRLPDKAVWIITARHGQRRGGLAATWVLQSSLDPQRPSLLASLSANHYTAELVAASQAFGAHLMRPDQADLALRFAIGSGRDRDKLAGLKFSDGTNGSPLLDDCLARLECQVTSQQEIGGRIYFWADVIGGEQFRTGPYLTEQQLLVAASPDQKAALRAGLLADIAAQQAHTTEHL